MLCQSIDWMLWIAFGLLWLLNPITLCLVKKISVLSNQQVNEYMYINNKFPQNPKIGLSNLKKELFYRKNIPTVYNNLIIFDKLKSISQPLFFRVFKIFDHWQTYTYKQSRILAKPIFQMFWCYSLLLNRINLLYKLFLLHSASLIWK